MAREFIMQKPSYNTKQRIKEVIFWLIIKQIKSENSTSLYIDNVIENLALLYNCKVTNINYAIANLEYIVNRPNPVELGLANKYADVQIRTICKVAKVANKTIYNALEDYVNEGSPELVPRLSDTVLIDIEKFIKGMSVTFEKISHMVKVTQRDNKGKTVPGLIYD